jgi:hypothetical protein
VAYVDVDVDCICLCSGALPNKQREIHFKNEKNDEKMMKKNVFFSSSFFLFNSLRVSGLENG